MNAFPAPDEKPNSPSFQLPERYHGGTPEEWLWPREPHPMRIGSPRLSDWLRPQPAPPPVPLYPNAQAAWATAIDLWGSTGWEHYGIAYADGSAWVYTTGEYSVSGHSFNLVLKRMKPGVVVELKLYRGFQLIAQLPFTWTGEPFEPEF